MLYNAIALLDFGVCRLNLIRIALSLAANHPASRV